MPLRANATPQYKTAQLAIRITPAKKKYLEEHYGAMLPKLLNVFVDKMVSNAAIGFKPKDVEIIKELIQD